MERNSRLVNLLRELVCGVSTQVHWRTATPSRGATGVKLAWIAWLSLAGTAGAQIQILALVNSASYQAGIPEPGSLATIFCTGLTGIAGAVSPATQSPLPLELAGVHVTINFGAAPLLVVADLGGGMQQVNLQVPPERILMQMSTVRVTQNGSLGKVDNVDYPGVGGFFSDDHGSAVALHVADGTAITPQNPAHAGELIVAYGTGFGPTYPPKPIGFPAPMAPLFQGAMDFTEPNTSCNIDAPARQLTLQSKIVHVSFSGVPPGWNGVDQIVFQLPDGLTAGAPSLVLAAGVISCAPPPFVQPCTFQATANSNMVKISVH